jgi:hypothetical protein
MQESGNIQGFERMCKVSFIVGTPLVYYPNGVAII